mmetsp:Transcript_32608/g.55127  ORF Transcript_32608/g.55127 Transcript_32608/m.55127 type:complete len:157 (-) Transcript_32608:45-515(-)
MCLFCFNEEIIMDAIFLLDSDDSILCSSDGKFERCSSSKGGPTFFVVIIVIVLAHTKSILSIGKYRTLTDKFVIRGSNTLRISLLANVEGRKSTVSSESSSELSSSISRSGLLLASSVIASSAILMLVDVISIRGKHGQVHRKQHRTPRTVHHGLA